jgi:hypothetical protein
VVDAVAVGAVMARFVVVSVAVVFVGMLGAGVVLAFMLRPSVSTAVRK